MWQTPLGPRVLQGAEAELFRVAAGIYQTILLDMVGEGVDLAGETSPEVDRWERIPWHQQVCAIGEVASYLLGYTEDACAPMATAWAEITIFKIYDFLIDSEDVESFGEYVVRAAVAAGLWPKKKRAIDSEQYKALLVQLRDRLIHDRDFGFEEVERVRRQGLKALALPEDYFAALFPSFTMGRFMASLALLNDDRVMTASALLPAHCVSRFESNRDSVPDPIQWTPPS
jgi:hypothetical protein